MTPPGPLEGWDEEKRGIIQEEVVTRGWLRWMQGAGGVLLASVPSFDQPPTLDDLSKVIASPSNPEGSWDASAWEEPKPFTAEELASLRAEFGYPGEEPEDPDTANADELARFQKDVARVNGWAAAYGLPPVRTCRDTLNLFLVAGVLHKVVEDGAVRFRPAWPFVAGSFVW